MHPGAFFSGSNHDPDQHAESFVYEHDFIVVQTNYRLGPSGFWFNPAAGEDEYKLTLLGAHQILLTGRPCLGSGTSIFPLYLQCVSPLHKGKNCGSVGELDLVT